MNRIYFIQGLRARGFDFLGWPMPKRGSLRDRAMEARFAPQMMKRPDLCKVATLAARENTEAKLAEEWRRHYRRATMDGARRRMIDAIKGHALRPKAFVEPDAEEFLMGGLF